VPDFTTPLTAILRKADDAVVPAFALRIERRTWLLADDDAPVVLDRGKVIAGERTRSGETTYLVFRPVVSKRLRKSVRSIEKSSMP